VDLCRLSATPDRLGCRHRSHCENGVEGIRLRFSGIKHRGMGVDRRWGVDSPNRS
jgi:hypothetical protein